MNLTDIAEDIRNVIYNRQKEYELSFIEDTHTYFMKDMTGKVRNDYPSVSKVLKYFYDEFDSDSIAYKKAKGDLNKKEELLNEWKRISDLSLNLGSRTHYLLEKEILSLFNIDKVVREPVFECDFETILKSDSMVSAGIRYANLMKERGAILLDTEVVMGHPELEYVGQADKLWLIQNKEKTDFGLIVTDWKTGNPKNFIPTMYTKKMKYPFFYLDDTALGHYSIQLPLYGKLFLKMLEGTKYEKLKLYGSIVVLLKENGDFEEFRIDKEIIDNVLSMNPLKYKK